LPTAAQIIAYAEMFYPRGANVSDANKIIVLNQIQDEIVNRLLRVKWENEPVTSYSIADQKTYTLPTGCKPDNIIKIQVSQVVTGSITDSTEWDTFEYVGINDNRDVSEGCYYSFVNDATAVLIKDGVALQTTNLEIRWYFFKEPTALAAVTDTPEVEAKYHNLFKYGLIQNLASMGHKPDGAIADYWQKKYDEELATNIKNLSDRFNSAPTNARECEERM
jgi:hypothetical protein